MATNQRESRKKQVIAIVGAGISGLLACKYSLSKGFDPIVFESEGSIGGVWTKTIGSTKLQTPRPVYQFSDFPWPDSVTDVFPDQQTVLEYIESYAHHFNLLRHIQFNSKVLSLSYESGGGSDGEWNLWGGTGEPFSSKGKWNVTVQDTRTPSPQVYQVDFVVVCVGRFSQVPNIPQFPPNKGPQAFQGEVIHSMDYSKMDSTTATNFVKGKNVAVIGSQKSGMDIAMECSTVNGIERPCTVLTRTPHWNIPDYFPWGFPLAYLYLSRFSELMVHKPGEGLLLSLLATTLSPLRWAFSKFVESHIQHKLGLAKHGIVPEHSFLNELSSCLISLVPEEFYDRVGEGSIKLKKAKSFGFSKEGIVLEGQAEPIKSDLVILATGFKGIDKLKHIFESPRFQDFIAGTDDSAEEQKLEQEFVWTLDYTNYSDIISQHKMIVVEFYAPWCGYCQQLAPKYEEAASVLSSHDPPVILAKMDTTVPENAELARNYTHNGVPSIKIFRNGGKTVHDYKGTRETDGIISYLKKHAGPASLEIKSKEDAASLIDEKKIVVVGIFPELCLEKIMNFTVLAEDLRVDYDFVHTLDAKFLPRGGPVDKPTIRLFKPFDELYADFEDFQVEAMQNFIEETSVPIMAILDDKPENQAFVNHFLHSPGDKVFLFLNFTTDLDHFKSKYYDLAASYKGKEANFLLGDAETGKRALEYFGLNTDQVPLIFVLAMDGTKYVQRHVQPDSLAAWLKDFKDGKLKPYLKSQPIPEVNNEPVKVVVAETLEDMVFNSGKDVLLEFYRLGCKYCEEFAPVLDEIALSFENDADVLIAKIDGTENDIPRERFEVQGFPTLYMISTAGSLSRFEGNRTKEAVIEFIQTNRDTPAPSDFAKSDLTVSEHAQTDSMKDEL